jgi:hypothetical protein
MNPEFKRFPHDRLYMEYPWQIWALGWIAVIRSIVWLFMETNTDISPEILLWKHILFTIPFFVLGIGAWNFRIWARKGLFIASLLDLFIYLILPTFFELDFITGARTQSIMLALEYIAGPLGDFIILGLLLSGWQFFGKARQFLES